MYLAIEHGLFFLYCLMLFFPYFCIVFQVSMILFGAQIICVMVHDMRRENRARATRGKIARKDGLCEWHIDTSCKLKLCLLTSYWSHNISKDHSYLNIIFPSRYLFSSPFFVSSLLSPSFLSFASFPLNSMKFCRQVFIPSFLCRGGKSFSTACLLRLWLLLSVDTFEFFINLMKLCSWC